MGKISQCNVAEHVIYVFFLLLSVWIAEKYEFALWSLPLNIRDIYKAVISNRPVLTLF